MVASRQKIKSFQGGMPMTEVSRRILLSGAAAASAATAIVPFAKPASAAAPAAGKQNPGW